MSAYDYSRLILVTSADSVGVDFGLEKRKVQSF